MDEREKAILVFASAGVVLAGILGYGVGRASPRIIEKRVEVPVERVIEKRVEVPVEKVIEKRVEVESAASREAREKYKTEIARLKRELAQRTSTVAIPVAAPADSRRSGTAGAEKPLEYKLAVINKGGYVSRDDITVTRFRYLLDKIGLKTGYPHGKIADMSVAAHRSLREEYGKRVTLLALMEESRKTLAAGAVLRYEEVLAAMVVLLGNQ